MALNKAPQRYVVERMQASDLDGVMEIERVCFRSPWSRRVFQEELDREWARLDVVRDLVTGQAVAFCNYWLVCDEVHILNLATHPRNRREGHASRLLAYVVERARRAACRQITLEVRRSNEAANRLYRRFAFHAVGVRPQYYAEDHEDAIIMLLELK